MARTSAKEALARGDELARALASGLTSTRLAERDGVSAQLVTKHIWLAVKYDAEARRLLGRHLRWLTRSHLEVVGGLPRDRRIALLARAADCRLSVRALAELASTESSKADEDAPDYGGSRVLISATRTFARYQADHRFLEAVMAGPAGSIVREAAQAGKDLYEVIAEEGWTAPVVSPQS